MKFAPSVFREERKKAAIEVEDTLKCTDYLLGLTPEILALNPGILPTLRMSTCPPIARDRLVGLAGVSKTLVNCLEKHRKLPPRMKAEDRDAQLERIIQTILRLADPDLLPWLASRGMPAKAETQRAAVIIADRLCAANADPIVRNAQETRQLDLIEKWLSAKGYKRLKSNGGVQFDKMEPGTFCFRLNVPVNLEGTSNSVNIPIDAVVMPQRARRGELPLFIEAKSAGDFTNVNKRRKEEAKKVLQLRATHGAKVRYILFLCGYFDEGYLKYEAADGIDWVWEHRIDDLAAFGL